MSGGGTTIGVQSGGFSPSTMLERIKLVDGAGSGLDADMLDGLHAASFLTSATAGFGYARVAKTATFTVMLDDRGTTFSCTAAPYTVALTAAATLGAGFVCAIYNAGANAITINPNGIEEIATPVGPVTTLDLTFGQGVFLTCNGTGFEVSAAVGIYGGSSAVWGSSRVAKSAAFAIDSTQGGITFDCTGGPYAVTLGPAGPLGDGFVCAIYNSDSGLITITADGSESIRTPTANDATLVLSQGMGVLLMSDGTNWKVVANSGLAPSPGAGLLTDDITADTTSGIRLRDEAGVVVATIGGASGNQTTTFSGPVVLSTQALTLTLGNLNVAVGTAQLDGPVNVKDGSFRIRGSADSTKTIGFEVDAMTANDDLTINSGAQTDDRTLTVPVLTGNATLAVLEETQAFTGTKTFAATTQFNGNLLMSSATASILKTLDNAALLFAAGSAVDPANGASMLFFGHTHGSLPGNVYIDTSNASTATLNFRGYNNNGLLRATSDGNTGAGTGYVQVQCTDAATTAALAGFRAAGGAFSKNIITATLNGDGVAITATAAGTTTLTTASAPTQIFTGSTTQTIQFPSAALYGAGIAVKILVINRSTGTVTPTRAGSDTFVGGGTTDPVLTTLQVQYISDGVSVWYKLAV